MSRPLRILLAEDNAAYRRGLRDLLESVVQFEVVGEAANGDEAVRMTAELRPDVVIMDLRMPDARGVHHDRVGLDAIRQISSHDPPVPVVVLSSADDDGLRSRSRLLGARGYLLKGSDKPTVIAAICTSLDGHRPGS